MTLSGIHTDTIFTVAPSIQITQLCLEFIYSVSLFVAICLAQPKRVKKSKANDEKESEKCEIKALLEE